MNKDINSQRSPIWNFNTIFFLLMSLPGIALITASFLVNQDTTAEDGHRLNTLLLIMGVFFLLTNGAGFVFNFITNKKLNEIRLNGIIGTATILEVQETGTKINGIPQLKFLLEVNDGFNPVRELEHYEVVPLLKIAELKKNTQVQVKVHPKYPGKVLLYLDEA